MSFITITIPVTSANLRVPYYLYVLVNDKDLANFIGYYTTNNIKILTIYYPYADINRLFTERDYLVVY